jgi:hypothetical protein
MRGLIAVALACCLSIAGAASNKASSESQLASQQFDNAAQARVKQASDDHTGVNVAKPASAAVSAPIMKNDAQPENSNTKTSTKSPNALFVGFLAENWDKILMVLFNGMLAVTTLLLWRSTEKLWGEAKITSQTTAASVNAFISAESPFLAPALDRMAFHESMYADHPDNPPTANNRHIRFGFENFGKSAALIEELQVHTHTGGSPPDRSAYTNDAPSILSGPIIVRPMEKSGVTAHAFFLSDEDLDLVKRGKSTLHFYGCIRYSTVFGNRIESGFCLQYEWVSKTFAKSGAGGNQHYSRKIA